MSIKLLHGKVEERIPDLPESSFHAVFCDPPYGLKFMGKHWDHGVPSVEVWKMVFRVLKPGGLLLAFGGTRTHHRLWSAIEDAGFELRDTLMWVYGSGFPKSLNISKAIDKAAGATREVVGKRTDRSATLNTDHRGGRYIGGKGAGIDLSDITAPATDAAHQWDGYGTQLKPAYEPICLAMKPLEGNFVDNTLKHGAGGLNVDGCRVEIDKQERGRVDSRSGSRVKEAPSDWGKRGTYEAGRIFRSHEAGRWPANLLHDDSDEVVRGFPETDGRVGKTQHCLGTNSIFGEFNRSEQSFGRDDVADSGSAARFFYSPKVSKKERLAGCKENKHPTLKPVALCEYLARLILPPADGRLLIPYAGTGSEMIGALFAGWSSICAIEQEREHNLVCRERVGFARRFSTLSEWSAAL